MIDETRPSVVREPAGEQMGEELGVEATTSDSIGRTRAVLQALLVTFLWSTSWVLIKIALAEIPPLIFAALRYTFAFLILLPLLYRRRGVVRTLTGSQWRQLALLGIVFYTFTQGGQFLTLKYLEATTFSLLLNFTSVLVLLFGFMTLAEAPSRRQVGGLALLLVGVMVYFYPLTVPAGQPLGLALAGLTVCANAAAAVLGRSVNRQSKIPASVVTVVSMGIGAIVLLVVGLLVQDMPSIGWTGWGIIIWLAAINTAFAFTLWNVTLRTLSAMESSIINNTMLIQIAILAWVFLGEHLSAGRIAGLILVAAGAFVVQMAEPKRASVSEGASRAD